MFGDGSLYLTDLQLSFSGNYSCQAVSNPTVKQTHVVHVLGKWGCHAAVIDYDQSHPSSSPCQSQSVNPIVEVSPRFQWTPIGGVASFECRFETFDDQFAVEWFKNDQHLTEHDDARVTILNNGTLMQVTALQQTDTGAYTCRVVHPNGVYGQSVASLLVQDETVESVAGSEARPQRLWIFHVTGLTIYEGILFEEILSRLLITRIQESADNRCTK